MTEHPILFNDEMVRAILQGRKTVTRRVLRPQPQSIEDNKTVEYSGSPDFLMSQKKSPFGVKGDRLWVREAHAIIPRTAYQFDRDLHPNCWQTLRPENNHDAAVYREGWTRCDPGRWRPSIHMPRWASRIDLEVIKVSVERVQEINYDDAMAEGIPETAGEAYVAGLLPDNVEGHIWDNATSVENFANLWDSINEKRGHSWESNPWVWRVEFKRL